MILPWQWRTVAFSVWKARLSLCIKYMKVQHGCCFNVSYFSSDVTRVSKFLKLIFIRNISALLQTGCSLPLSVYMNTRRKASMPFPLQQCRYEWGVYSLTIIQKLFQASSNFLVCPVLSGYTSFFEIFSTTNGIYCTLLTDFVGLFNSFET